MNKRLSMVLRGVAGLIACVAAYYGALWGYAVIDIVTRPINQGWVELLVLLLLPIFIGVAVLAVVALVLGRYAWLGRVW
jgi:hypothetical protein